MRLQPVAQRQQPPHRGLKLRELLRPPTAPAANTHTRSHLRLVHVQPGGAPDDRLHHCLLSNDETTIVVRGASKQTTLMGVLYGNSPAYRGDSGAMLTAGSRAP